MGMRIKRDVTITWEMSEDIAYTLMDILTQYDSQGVEVQDDAISLSLDSLQAALPRPIIKDT